MAECSGGRGRSRDGDLPWRRYPSWGPKMYASMERTVDDRHGRPGTTAPESCEGKIALQRPGTNIGPESVRPTNARMPIGSRRGCDECGSDQSPTRRLLRPRKRHKICKTATPSGSCRWSATREVGVECCDGRRRPQMGGGTNDGQAPEWRRVRPRWDRSIIKN
jgi:hypothetical protein